MKIYFDESNHSRKIGLSAKDNSKLTFIEGEELFYYTFIGFEDDIDNKYIEIERKYFKNAENGEIKSKKFFRGMNNINEISSEKKMFIIEFLTLIENECKLIQVASLNKVYLILMNVFYDDRNSFDSELEYKNRRIYIAFLSKFILNQNLEVDFFKKATNGSSLNSLLRWIRLKIYDSINELKNLNRFEHDRLIGILSGWFNYTQKYIKMTNREKIILINSEFDYFPILQSWLEIKEESKVTDYQLLIDKEDKIIETLKTVERDVIGVDSKKVPGVRICDVFLGLIRNIARYSALYHSSKAKFGENFKRMNIYPAEMFECDDLTKLIYKKLWKIINNGNRWSTFHTRYADEFVSGVVYIEVMAGINPRSFLMNDMLNERLNKVYFE